MFEAAMMLILFDILFHNMDNQDIV
jgi:hypothetical protein